MSLNGESSLSEKLGKLIEPMSVKRIISPNICSEKKYFPFPKICQAPYIKKEGHVIGHMVDGTLIVVEETLISANVKKEYEEAEEEYKAIEAKFCKAFFEAFMSNST